MPVNGDNNMIALSKTRFSLDCFRLSAATSTVTLLICLSLLSSSGAAQSGGVFEITGAAVAASSTEMSGDDFVIAGTLGQPAAGDGIGSGPFGITSGFWNYTALAPTAAGVTLSGRVVTANGVGISNARMFLQTQRGDIFVSRSASFGYYMFENIEAGQTVFITVEHKLHTFSPRTVMVADSVSNLDFVPEP